MSIKESTSVNNVLLSMRNVEKRPDVQIISYESVADNAFKVVMSSHTSKEYPEAIYASEIARMFDGKASLVEGSVMRKRVGSYSQASAYIVANVESKEATQDVMKGMKLVTANVFLDEDDNSIWNVTETSAGNFLTRSSEDDLEELMNLRKSSAIITASIDSSLSEVSNFDTGDFGIFFHPETASMKYGFIAKTEKGLSAFGPGMKSFTPITAACIVDAIPAKDMVGNNAYGFSRETAASISSQALTTYLDYQKKMFKGTDYFDNLSKLLAEKLGLGDLGLVMASEK